tara:strand:- start:488 stop:664 length:177 start_codon:yes stop_codon:yes gene_type:complete
MRHAKFVLEKELNKIATKSGAVRKNPFGPEYQESKKQQISDLQYAIKILNILGESNER